MDDPMNAPSPGILNAIIGLNIFATKIKDINNASHNDDPYADYFLLLNSTVDI
jgi:hypothetical protein